MTSTYQLVQMQKPIKHDKLVNYKKPETERFSNYNGKGCKKHCTIKQSLVRKETMPAHNNYQLCKTIIVKTGELYTSSFWSFSYGFLETYKSKTVLISWIG